MTGAAQFHTHIAFPDTLLELCTQFVADHPSWKIGKIGDVYFPQDPALHEKHVVRGACNVLTVKPSDFKSALREALTGFEALPSKEQIRLEIEQILNVNGQPLHYETIQLKDAPTFESHIVIQRKDGGSIKNDRLDTLATQLGMRYDMFDLIAADTKGTITTYYADRSGMEIETKANAKLLMERLGFEAIIHTKLERVLYSGLLNTLPEWIKKQGLSQKG
jgi:hypothetical protein